MTSERIYTETSLFDPLGIGTDLPLRTRLWPLGFPVEVATNSPLVIQAARQSWGCFRERFFEPRIQLRFVVNEDDTSPLPPEPVVRAQRYLLASVAGRGNCAFCDMERGLGSCWVSATVAAHAEYLRYHFLEAMVYTMLEHLRVTSVHAGCVALDDRGVLLFGPSGAGKSCLTFSCARQGWTLIDDDGSSLMRGGCDNLVLGDPYHLRFRPSAAELFPELRKFPLSTTRRGEKSIEVFTGDLPDIRTAESTRVEQVVFLDRQAAGSASLVPLSKGEARSRLEAELPLFDEAVHEEHMASLANLVRSTPHVLRYSDLDSAVEKLEEVLS